MDIHFFDEVDSTNNVIKKMAEEGANHGTVVVAESQSAGRGRIGRAWISPKGTGIWMSLLLRPMIKPESASMLTLVAALAVRGAIETMTGAACLIKWPNDLVLNGRKICGILTEMNAQVDRINYVVVGIGINVNMESFPEELTNTASSLYIETGRKFTRRKIIDEFCKVFEKYYDVFLQTEDLSRLYEEYNGCLANYNNQVKILDTKESYVGVSQGINQFGELIVMDESGKLQIVRSGEVSVRGIYGYV